MRPLATFATIIVAAGLAAALCAHALLQSAARFPIGASAYAGHAHGGVVPAMAVTATLFAMLAAAFARDALIARRDATVRRVRRLALRDVLSFGAGVTLVAAATLFGMEACESGAAVVNAGWLGGNALAGAVVLTVSAALATSFITCAHDQYGAALDGAVALLSRCLRAIAVCGAGAPILHLGREAAYAPVPAREFVRSTGLRAPPRATF